MGLRVCALLVLLSCSDGGIAATNNARAFDGGRAFRDLVKQCAFGARIPGAKAHDSCEHWLAEQLRGCGAEVTVDRFTESINGHTVSFANIEADFNPAGRRRVVLCAHWDSKPTADEDPDPAKRAAPMPGANDGASGVAVLLEIGRALKAKPPRDRVTLVLFDGEDYGTTTDTMFFGSRRFARRYHGPAISWAVLLDMVGDRDLRIPKEQISLTSARGVVGRVWKAAADVDAKAFVEARGPAILDDHVLLLQHGIPCVDVIDFDYPYWHTTADTPDKCSAESLEQVGRTVLRTISDFESEGDQKGQ
jgi:hypothetical protein